MKTFLWLIIGSFMVITAQSQGSVRYSFEVLETRKRTLHGTGKSLSDLPEEILDKFILPRLAAEDLDNFEATS